jgi:tetratricopeptide (TPR) repeat protein
MKTKILLAVICILSFGYIALSMLRAAQLQSYEDVTGIFWQIGIVLIAGISFGLILREIWFGLQLQKLASIMNKENLLLPDTLEKLPSGRTDRSDADRRFLQMKQEVQSSPNRWQSWFRLGLAYDEAGDRRRARECMRKALQLFRSSP